MKKFVVAAAVAALVAGGSTAPAFASNLLVNGSFESGLSSWTAANIGVTNSNPVVIEYGQASNYPTGAYGEAVPAVSSPTVIGSFVNPGYDPVGTHGLYLSSDTGTQTISQSVALAAGSYTFGFDFYLPANGVANINGATFEAFVGAQSLGSFSASDYTAQKWYTFTGSMSLVDAGTFTFSFMANGNPAKDFVIDRVFLAPTSEQQSGVPEAGTWAMMVVGFGAIGAASRRRRTSLTFA
jgi:hypothetical protein